MRRVMSDDGRMMPKLIYLQEKRVARKYTNPRLTGQRISLHDQPQLFTTRKR